MPHSVRIFHDLGFVDTLLANGVETGTLFFCNKFGQAIKSEPTGIRAGYRYPQISIHRGFLQMLLFEEAKRRLGDGLVVAGYALDSWEETAVGVKITLKKSYGSFEQVEGCCLIWFSGEVGE